MKIEFFCFIEKEIQTNNDVKKIFLTLQIYIEKICFTLGGFTVRKDKKAELIRSFVQINIHVYFSDFIEFTSNNNSIESNFWL